ncbi:MAG: DUF998 domain-containing protein [Prevotella sp.]|nr:DUF998 domain-containing protein [Prevotella sp.]
MENLTDGKIFNALLLFTVVGEFFLPWLLKRFYGGYDSKKTVMSVLGSPESPVRRIYNGWLIWLGLFLSLTAFAYFREMKENSPVLAVLTLLSVGVFAVGAGLLSGIFSVNESKDTVTTASKIHGAGAAIGFMTLLFFPLITAFAAFGGRETVYGAVCVIAFIFALVFFVIFIMGGKERFRGTVLSYEGLWERLALFCMYAPFYYRAVKVIFSKG